jgi:hypothetical protein
MGGQRMPESTLPDPPTFFANVATIHVNIDEVSIEFRRVTPEHANVWAATKGGTLPTPTLTDTDIFKLVPIARVVLSFRGAKVLKDNLDKLLPRFEEMRKQGL